MGPQSNVISLINLRFRKGYLKIKNDEQNQTKIVFKNNSCSPIRTLRCTGVCY